MVQPLEITKATSARKTRNRFIMGIGLRGRIGN